MAVKEEIMLQKIVENSQAVIFMKDQEGRFVMVNDRFLELFGMKKEDIIGKTDYDVQTKEQAEFYRANDQKVRETHKAISFKEDVQQNGQTRTYISHKFPVNNIAKHPNSVASISIDITEHE